MYRLRSRSATRPHQVEAGGLSFFAERALGRSTRGGGTWVAQVKPDCAL